LNDITGLIAIVLGIAAGVGIFLFIIIKWDIMKLALPRLRRDGQVDRRYRRFFSASSLAKATVILVVCLIVILPASVLIASELSNFGIINRAASHTVTERTIINDLVTRYGFSHLVFESIAVHDAHGDIDSNADLGSEERLPPITPDRLIDFTIDGYENRNDGMAIRRDADIREYFFSFYFEHFTDDFNIEHHKVYGSIFYRFARELFLPGGVRRGWRPMQMTIYDHGNVREVFSAVEAISPRNDSTIYLSKSAFEPGERLSFRMTGVPQEMFDANAWVAIYEMGAPHDEWLDIDLRGTASGAFVDGNFELPETPGLYEVRVFEVEEATEATFLMSVPFVILEPEVLAELRSLHRPRVISCDDFGVVEIHPDAIVEIRHFFSNNILSGSIFEPPLIVENRCRRCGELYGEVETIWTLAVLMLATLGVLLLAMLVMFLHRRRKLKAQGAHVSGIVNLLAVLSLVSLPVTVFLYFGGALSNTFILQDDYITVIIGALPIVSFALVYLPLKGKVRLTIGVLLSAGIIIGLLALGAFWQDSGIEAYNYMFIAGTVFGVGSLMSLLTNSASRSALTAGRVRVHTSYESNQSGQEVNRSEVRKDTRYGITEIVNIIMARLTLLGLPDIRFNRNQAKALWVAIGVGVPILGLVWYLPILGIAFLNFLIALPLTAIIIICLVFIFAGIKERGFGRFDRFQILAAVVLVVYTIPVYNIIVTPGRIVHNNSLTPHVSIEQQLPDDDVTQAFAETYLDLSDSGITDEILTEMFRDGRIDYRITRLSLSGNELTRFSIPGSFENLIHLDLSNNQISDITFLSESPATLQDLYLSNNQISDITPLESLRQPRILMLNGNQIADITPLGRGRLRQLNVLNLSDNRIDDIEPLRSLSELELLALHDNQISDVSPLQSLSELRLLLLSNNPISDVTPLMALSNLTGLSIQGSPAAQDEAQMQALSEALPNCDITS